MKDVRGGYVVKFSDQDGQEHTWVDEYELNGLPALYIQGKGHGQVHALHILLLDVWKVWEVPILSGFSASKPFFDFKALLTICLWSIMYFYHPFKVLLI